MGCGGSKQTGVEENRGSPAKKKPPANNTSSPNKTSPAKPATKGNNQNANTTKGKYVVNGSTGGNSSHRGSVFSEATDKGYKKRVRDQLKEATAGSDMEVLEKAIEKFQRQNMEDCGDYSRALDRMEFLTLRRDLRDAVRRSHVGVLEKTIQEAESSQYSSQLSNQIEAARQKLQHLKELNEYKHDILTMEQSTISEIHSYQRPPTCVHDVMVATYLLLGHPEPRLTDWVNIQTLLCRVGRDSLIHEIRDFDSANVDDQTTKRVQQILHPHELHTIRQASNGAATFYVWTTQICGKVERDNAEEGAVGRQTTEEKNNDRGDDTNAVNTRKKKKG